ncbi:aldo/keto reductase [Pseudonocardia hispaniensis]|uniref:Aldo/keto reductase n=1 Tax=Pseudonocardia hispaniensis TaxID=904933 RepID=A0ABW1IZY0_9PSEU
MRTRRLGSTELRVSELGFGCFAIGGNRSGNSYGPTDDATSIAAVRTALELGYRFFDTADVYGLGHSETLLGRALREAGHPSDVVVATKGGARFDGERVRADFSGRHLRSAVEASLRRLGRDRVELYQLHDPPLSVLRAGAVFDVLDGLVAEGRIDHYGVSVHTPPQVAAALAHPRVRTVQIPFSLLTQVEPQDAWEAVFADARRRDVGLIAREPLAAGFLSGRHAGGRTYGAGDLRGRWPPARRRIYIALAEVFRHHERPDRTMAQAALRFVLDEPAFATTIVGIKTPAQARENVAATGLPPFAELEAGQEM